jgi:hypothetical protein
MVLRSVLSVCVCMVLRTFIECVCMVLRNVLRVCVRCYVSLLSVCVYDVTYVY